ncbi:cytochrome b561 domain-containing protein At4g18260-like [Rhodamnia argentea]|uniref:Cytochrome b561 domain-containing protein At4g18260-like n=1 Tax=Rhodamnia argentea TaxID=178133 RepID=A0A8B8N4J4_9MYRT|nr:cytochrome b561 domain-containing protein At4g18260-like [Rhodamnia argentea]
MLVPHKVCFRMSTLLVVFSLPMFAGFSQESVGSHTSSSGDAHNVSPCLLFEITLHGFLLWASLGLLMPLGVLVIRMSNRGERGIRLKIYFRAHAILQMLSVLLATAGAIMSIKNFSNSFNNHHQRIGLVLYGIIWLQALVGFLRPVRGSKGRSPWFFGHWTLGTAVSLLGVINIYSGLLAYSKKTSRSIRLWVILFTVEVSFISFFYLLQDKWEHIQKQGVILGNEPSRPI